MSCREQIAILHNYSAGSKTIIQCALSNHIHRERERQKNTPFNETTVSEHWKYDLFSRTLHVHLKWS